MLHFDESSVPERTGLGREKLLRAAREVIAEFGIEGLRVRRIAAAAGVSAPLVSYHYSSQASLVLRVHHDLVLDYFAHREAQVRAAAGAVLKFQACARSGLPPGVEVDLIAPLFEMHGLARRNEEHAQLMSDLWRSEHALYVQIISQGEREGLFTLRRPVGDVAGALLALEDGLALHLVGRNTEISGEWALDRLLSFAAEELQHAPLAECP